MSDTPKAMVHEAVNEFRTSTNGQVVLVLQGGGALGAYQVGVYQALHEAGVEPDWIIGTSIGAINAAIIAGNEPQDRLTKLDEFWKRMERSNAWPFVPAWTGISDAWSYWSTLVSGIPGFFKPNLPAFWGAHIPLGVDRAGFYSTASLRETLAELVDWSIINRRSPRLTVGAANVRTSMMHYFDSRQSEILGRVGMTEAEVRKSGTPALISTMPMEDVSRAFEKGETKGFMKILVDRDSKQILGASFLGLAGDEVVHCVLDLMYAKAPYTVMQRAMHIHPTVSEFIPTMMSELQPLQ